MDWEKVKRIVIVWLVVLNIGLFGLNRYQDSRYELTEERIRAVTEVASRSGVTLSCDLPSSSAPLRELALSVPAAEVEKLQKLYFDGGSGVEVTAAGGDIVLQRGRETLYVSGNLLYYQNPEGLFQPELFNEEGARAAAQEFIRSLSGGADSVKEAHMSFDRGCFTFTYYSLYKGNCLYSSSRKIQVRNEGVTSYFVEDYTVDGYAGSRKSIYAADEAVLAYCRLRADSGKAEGTEITAVERGYAIDKNTSYAQVSGVKMVPCYAIYAKGEEAPVMINALTNTLIS